MTITQNHLQFQFKHEVTAMSGGEWVQYCFECGACTGVCPVSQVNPAFDPRKILHMIKLGLKDRLLSSEVLWYCSHCDTCTFVCPQGIRFGTIAGVLREMASKQGYVDSTVLERWGTGPCKAVCPAHISIQGFVGAIAQGRFLDGLKLIKKEMPFPGICGRVCPHPCEAECNRNLIDQPIAVMSLKRFLADWDLMSETSYVPEIKERKHEKVAVIGSGPAGLTTAYYLAIEGYPVIVFEKNPVAGGMMAMGIPEYRLPRDILQKEIEGIKKLGVEIRLNCEVGKDIPFEDIQSRFQAIFISVGCDRGLKLGIRGEDDFDGVIDAVSFLKDVHLGNPPAAKDRLVVVGGGNAAIDCARVAMRLGYGNVVILYRRTREEMPANPWEIEEALEEGIDIQFLTTPVRILGRNGRISGVECIRMQLGSPDESGRGRPIPVEGSQFTIRADTIIAAIGQMADLSFLSSEPEIRISRTNRIQVESLTGATTVPGIFAGGDVVTGPRTVVEAVALGKRAAISIARYLRENPLDMKSGKNWKGIALTPGNTTSMDREPMPRLSLAERSKTFREIDLGFNENQARREASRCFRICGIQKKG